MRHDSGGCCDCGDVQAILKEGWCKEHQGYDEIDDDDYQMEDIPQPAVMRIKEFLSMGISLLLEYSLKVQGKKRTILFQIRKVFKKFNINILKQEI